MTKVARDDAEGVVSGQVGREDAAKGGFLLLVDGPDEDRDDGDV